VLDAHRSLLGERVLADEEAVRVEGRTARVDLMLSRVSEYSETLRQHLVVELKRPSVTVGATEVSQVEQYAIAIAKDPRFHTQGVRWDFLLVAAKLDGFATERVDANGILFERDHLRVRVVPWDALLRARRHQMNFVQRELELATSTSEGLAELRRVHAAHLPDTTVATGSGEHLAAGDGGTSRAAAR
jgi:hypothetical protein